MYCPDCGAESTERRNYCKQCGGALTASPNTTDIATPSKPNALAWVIALLTVVIGLGGLAAIFMAAYYPGSASGIRRRNPDSLDDIRFAFGRDSRWVAGDMTLKLAGTSTGPRADRAQSDSPA